jgi:hypothetical protein
MHPLPIVVVAVLVLGLALLLRFRRAVIAAFFGYLKHREMIALRALVADYLAGRIALDPAATRLNRIMDQIGRYSFFASRLASGTASIEAVALAPPGVREDDPRINELWERGPLIRFGPERYHQMQDWFREQKEHRGSPGSPPSHDAGAA